MALAAAIGVSKQMVSHWFTGLREVSPEMCVEIERVTGGEVTRAELRPDIFGPLAVPSPQQNGAGTTDGSEATGAGGSAAAQSAREVGEAA